MSQKIMWFCFLYGEIKFWKAHKGEAWQLVTWLSSLSGAEVGEGVRALMKAQLSVQHPGQHFFTQPSPSAQQPLLSFFLLYKW